MGLGLPRGGPIDGIGPRGRGCSEQRHAARSIAQLAGCVGRNLVDGVLLEVTDHIEHTSGKQRGSPGP